jgi:hypothetical protein
MKLYAGLLVAAVAALITPSRADDSDKFVVRGDATKVIMEQNQINVATAEAISKACVEEAVKQGVKVSIVIYDQFGEPVYMYRMDGQAKVAIDTAMMKAHTVVNTRQPSNDEPGAVGPLLRATPIFVRQFRQFGGLADHHQRQSDDRRHRRRRFGAQSAGMERRNLRLARHDQSARPAARAAARHRSHRSAGDSIGFL